MSEEIKEQDNNKNKKKKIITLIIAIIGVLLIVIGVAMTINYFSSTQEADDDKDNFSEIMTTDATAENPIDFEALQEQNDEIYAWITVPGTYVDHPIVQSSESDDFYLKHSAFDKSYAAAGAIYTQSLNTESFMDRVTVIYGHNNYGNSFFTTLHNFEDQDVLDENPYFYIYKPNSKLTYQIVSAFKYDDRHILNSFNFAQDDVFQEFIDMIQNPSSTTKTVCKNLDKEITTKDKIVVLSTCVTGQKDNRYLVCGVLVNIEQTK